MLSKMWKKIKWLFKGDRNNNSEEESPDEEFLRHHRESMERIQINIGNIAFPNGASIQQRQGYVSQEYFWAPPQILSFEQYQEYLNLKENEKPSVIIKCEEDYYAWLAGNRK